LREMLRLMLTVRSHPVANRVASDAASRRYHPVANRVASPLPTMLQSWC
jgi:hypothetical protein